MHNIVNLVGGVGNQLFQYLFGTSLEHRTGTQTLYDVADFKSYNKHNGFSIEKLLAVTLPKVGDRPQDLPLLMRTRSLKRLSYRLPPGVLKAMRIRTDQEFRLSLAKPGLSGRYFYGHWQGIDYDIAELFEITAEWRFTDAVASEAIRNLDRVDADRDRDVAIHVRLGDYLRLTQSCHLPLTPAYYQRALAHLRASRPIRRIFLFSDDIEAARAMAIDKSVCSVAGSGSALVELCMLASFRTKLISASTFGWWAAALSQKGGETLYPSPWVKPGFTDNPILTPPALPGWSPVQAYDIAS